MGDYTSLNAGSGGDNIAADEIGAIKHQRVKVQYGEDGTATDASVTNPLPVVPQLNTDAFGRHRVSEPTPLFDSKLLHDKNPFVWGEAINNNTGNATSTYSPENACVTMYVEDGDRIIRQSRMHFNYQPGKSQLSYLTGVLGSGAGVTSRIGLFHYDGVFFEMDDNIMYVVVRKNNVDTRVAQANWNTDTMDGTGPSGITIDFTKAQIFFIDFEWLGVGTVRYGFAVDGQFYVCHKAHHANTVTSVYMGSPNLPVRYEIFSVGASASMDQICSTVMSEGGAQENGSTFYVTSAENIGGMVLSSAWQALVGVRLENGHYDGIVKPVGLSLIGDGAGAIEWALMVNPTIAGTFNYGTYDLTCIQSGVGVAANVVTGPEQTIIGGFFESDKDGGSQNSLFNSPRWLGTIISGAHEEWILAARALAGTPTAWGAMTLKTLH